MDNEFRALSQANSSFAIKITINIKPTWISTHRHMSCALWRQLEHEQKMPKWKVVMLLLCWIYSDQQLRVQCKLCMNINDVYFDDIECIMMFI